MRCRPVLWAVVACASGAAAVGLFIGNLAQLRAEAESTFSSRSELLTKFVALHRDQLTVMRNLVSDHLAAAGHAYERPPTIQMRPEYGVWEAGAGSSNNSGLATGDAGVLPGSSEFQELRAAQAMEAQIDATRQFDPDVVWFYYLSAHNFVYLAPRVSLAQFHFSPALYAQRYWSRARPEQDPEKQFILVGPYRDLAGRGQVLTFADPVYEHGEFRGIVALDVQASTLAKLTMVGRAVGESVLIADPQGGSATGSSDLGLRSVIVKDQLWLVHRVSLGDLYRAAARETLPAWIMMGLLLSTLLMAWRLRGALLQVIALTFQDPLTQTLNRRGLYKKAAATLALGERNGLLVAVLMMDIDLFKNINDSHGHGVGDSVLRQLGMNLLAAKRPFDLVCRWGGEEFVVLMTVADRSQAVEAAERMRQVARRLKIGDLSPAVTLSGGLVTHRPDETLDACINRADALLYRAKRGGRNRLVTSLGLTDTGRGRTPPWPTAYEIDDCRPSEMRNRTSGEVSVGK